MPPYTALWDLDGTLLDSSPLHAEAFSHVLATQGVYEFEYSSFAGWRTGDVFAAFGFEGAILAELTCAKRMFVARHLGEIKPFSDARAALERLRELGCAQSIVTGASRHRAMALLAMNGLSDLIGIDVAADTDVESKPSSAGYRYALATRGASAADAIVIEDSITTAENAVTDGFAAVFHIDRQSSSVLSPGILTVQSLSAVSDWVATRRGK